MGRAFSTQDADDIIERQWKIKQYLIFVAGTPERYRADVVDAADEIVMEEVMKALSEVPVEELRIGRQGFRLGALLMKGFHTVADVAAMEPGELSVACGISADDALAVMVASDEVIATTKKWVKVRLDPADKNDAATKLLTAVAKYSRCVAIAEKCTQLLEEYGSRIDSAIEELDPAVRGVDWLFTTAKNRVKAEDAFTALTELFNGEYGQQAHEELAQFEKLKKYETREAWIDYALSGDKFINTLRSVVPELTLDTAPADSA